MKRRRRGYQIVIGILTAALLLAGLWQGDVRTVRNKAIRICYECIGIG